MIESNREFCIAYMFKLKGNFRKSITSIKFAIDDSVKKDLPNVYMAFNELFNESTYPKLYYQKTKKFENVTNIYEAISTLLSNVEKSPIDLSAQIHKHLLGGLTRCHWSKIINISLCDLLVSIMFFTNDFILKDIKSEIVEEYNKNTLVIKNDFLLLDMYVEKNKIAICIDIPDFYRFIITNM